MLEPELEDSPDLTDEEVDKALPATEADIVGFLRGARCPTCEASLKGYEHELRRRAPDHYWRVRLRCVDGHESVVTYRMLEWRMTHG